VTVVSREKIVRRPPADVFDFVATKHFENHPRWDPELLEMTQTSPGPVGIGTTARVVRRQGRRRVEGTATVTAYEPGRVAAWDVRFGRFLLRQRSEYAPEEGGRATRLRLTIETRAWADSTPAAAHACALSQDDGQEPQHDRHPYRSKPAVNEPLTLAPVRLRASSDAQRPENDGVGSELARDRLERPLVPPRAIEYLGWFNHVPLHQSIRRSGPRASNRTPANAVRIDGCWRYRNARHGATLPRERPASRACLNAALAFSSLEAGPRR